jgi:hypothetical protein
MVATKPFALTERVVTQPSTVLPGVPPFMLSVPAGWVLDEAPGALAMVRSPKQMNGFWVNAILSHDKVARSVDFQQAAAFTWARLRQQVPDAEIKLEKFMRAGAIPMYIRGTEMSSTKSKRPISQLQAIWFAPVHGPGKVVDFFQFVCTAPTEVANEVGPAMMELIGSFKFI